MRYIIDSPIPITKIYYRRNMVMNVLIAMLEELLKKDDAENKKRKLQSEFGIEMSVEMTRRVNVMCNLSEVIQLLTGLDLPRINELKKNLK